MKKNIFVVFIILIFTSLIFSSCSGLHKDARYDLSNYVTYLETPPEYNIGQVLPRSLDFKPLYKRNMGNLNKLLEKDGDFLWLKIQFYIPEKIKK